MAGALGRDAVRAAEVDRRSDATGGRAKADGPAKPPELTAGVPTSPPWDLLAPLGPGSDLGHGWRLAELSGVLAGAFVATLEQPPGLRQGVQICRRGGEPNGIVRTARCDLFILNNGTGDLPTEEGLAQAVARLGLALLGNERSGKADPVLASLLTHEEWLTRLPGSSGGKLL